MLLIIEKGIRGGMCHVISRYAKANNTYMKHYKKEKKLSCLMYWHLNNLYGWAMSQKLLTNIFKLVKEPERFNKTKVKNYYDNSNEGYILEDDVE